MSRSFTYRVISLSMAIILLVTSSGIRMDVHFCQGKFKRANIFGKAKTCQEVKDCLIKCGKQTKFCHSENACLKGGDHNGCCKNESYEFDLDIDAFEVVAAELNEIQKPLLVGFIYTDDINLVPAKDTSKFTSYKPPPFEKDIAVLFQVFRL